jgi:hypothetical protein
MPKELEVQEIELALMEKLCDELVGQKPEVLHQLLSFVLLKYRQEV